ncbi:ANTAR domain-containing protein [Mycolicibacterium sp.]|jgi:hypothetical protein|uniref:ANTAR domain-containing protein n=1 Tax=Mycolicibacterium sp. TaxID=2320850 RepID=UPI0028A812DC|nr:ANTAR domain-containing protein [Mycolicibacterium sp.]
MARGASSQVSSNGSADARARFLSSVDGAVDCDDGAVRLCAACVLALPVRRAGIMITGSGFGLEMLSASDPVAERVEWTQITLSEGPAVDAISTGLPVCVPDLAKADGRWPVFLSEIAGRGIGGMYALPLHIGAIKVGALDLYSDLDAPLGPAGFADAIAISELITAVLLNVDKSGQIPGSLGSWWNQPLRSREVHQATGMVMAQLGIDARSAYVRLQGFAFGNGRLVRDVASDVINRRLRFSAGSGDGFSPESSGDPNMEDNDG